MKEDEVQTLNETNAELKQQLDELRKFISEKESLEALLEKLKGDVLKEKHEREAVSGVMVGLKLHLKCRIIA